MNYSVLMSVYWKEQPEYLRESMSSMLNQTLPTDDFVLVCDGPLGDELERVISQQQILFGDVLRVVRLEENLGLGRALNHGLQHCRNEFVARMDSDDVSLPDRCEKQMSVFFAQGDIDIVGGIVEEFRETIEERRTRRVPPKKHVDIIKYAKSRNPFNHPCVMIRKTAVDAAGSYNDFYLLEDYYLWIRMLLNGSKGYNIQESLLYMRTGSDMYLRRGGLKYVRSLGRLYWYMRSRRFISIGEYVRIMLVRSLVALVPNRIRKHFYTCFLRR